MAASMTRRALIPETRLLLLTAGPAGNDDAIAQLLEGDLNWRLFRGLASRSKATPVIWKRLERLTAGGANGEGMEILRKHAMVAEFRHAVLEQRFRDVIGLLQRHGIDPVLLKGAALAVTAYGSFQNRPMGDLDLLVESARANEAQRLLLDAGWTEEFPAEESNGRDNWRDEFYGGHHHLPALLDPTGTEFALELHTEIFPPGNPFALSAKMIRDRAESVHYRECRVLVPSPIHQMLHLCVHFAWAHMMRSGAWRTFRDIQAIVDTGAVDWPEFIRLARSNRAETCCYWTLRLARNLSGIAVPDEAYEALGPALPKPLLMRLDYHLTHEILPFEPICPSVRLRAAMWAAAIQPRRSGHGAARPWHHAGHFPVLSGAPSYAGSRKVWEHLRRVGRWAGYARAILAPPNVTAAAFPPARST